MMIAKYTVNTSTWTSWDQVDAGKSAQDGQQMGTGTSACVGPFECLNAQVVVLSADDIPAQITLYLLIV